MSFSARIVAARRRLSALERAAPWIVIAVSVALRLELYFANRSFWLDESLLGLNLIEKSVHGLLGTLAYGQSAPPGFLLAQKAALGLFGESERALRLLPLVSSIAGLVLFWLVARRLLARWPAVLALTVFATNDVLLYQSSEAKPYSSDVAIALGILLLALQGLGELDRGRLARALLPSTLLGLAAVWISYPAVFVLGATFCAFLARAVANRDRRLAAALGAAGTLVGGSMLAVYLVSARSISSVQRSVFVGDSAPSSRLRGLAGQAWEALSDPGGFPDKSRAIAVIVVAVGALVLFTKRRLDAIILVGTPTVLAMIASVVNAYPFGGRYSLFLVPYLAIVLTLGIAELVTTSRRPLLVGSALVAVLAVVPLGQAIGRALHPPAREDVRPLLRHLEGSWRAGDALYVYRNVQYALRFYGECRDCGVRPLPFPLRGAPPGADNGGTAAALASVPPEVIVGSREPTAAATIRAADRLRGHRRLWLLFAHSAAAGPMLDEQQLLLAELDTFGRRLGSWNKPGAALYLYDTAAR